MAKDKCLCVIHGIDTNDTIEALKLVLSHRNIRMADRMLKHLNNNIKSIEKVCGANLSPIYTDIATIRNELDLGDFNQAMLGTQSIIELIKEQLKRCP